MSKFNRDERIDLKLASLRASLGIQRQNSPASYPGSKLRFSIRSTENFMKTRTCELIKSQLAVGTSNKLQIWLSLCFRSPPCPYAFKLLDTLQQITLTARYEKLTILFRYIRNETSSRSLLYKISLQFAASQEKFKSCLFLCECLHLLMAENSK